MTIAYRFACALAALFALALPAAAADPPRELRGTSDGFAAAGVALAWGALRSAGDGQALIDVRLAVDPMTYPRVVVVARDPAASRERVLADSQTAGLTDVRVARATFERYPRTEFRLFATAKPEPGQTPKLVVYFVGVPETTPEFPNEARLDAHLSERIVRLRSAAPKAP